MKSLKSLRRLFENKIFRVPDYQRGYAWGPDQLMAFWEDLVHLSDGRSHYTGQLTLKEIELDAGDQAKNEYWLVSGDSYKMYQIVDGQQRLTTIVVFLQVLIDLIKEENATDATQGKEINITDGHSLETAIKQYLYKTKPDGANSRTYKFGYTVKNPSEKYLRHKIFGEAGKPEIRESFYTRNLSNARDFFTKKLRELPETEGENKLSKIYTKLTEQFKFNEQIIDDEFDVFVAFETINNRGKKLSDLELLKNRLIYLATLYPRDKLDEAQHRNLSEKITTTWQEIYLQLGRNSDEPALNDDEFLRAHWIMYFHYSRDKGKTYIKFLLDEYFSPRRILNPDADGTEGGALNPSDIVQYIDSLKESAGHWYNFHYPKQVSGFSDEEKQALDRLNRIGIGYFRPLVMAVLKNVEDQSSRIALFDHIEKFIFIVFRLCQHNRSYRNSEFYRVAHHVNSGEIKLKEVHEKITEAAGGCFDQKASKNANEPVIEAKFFHTFLSRKFNEESGYYGWSGLKYFLFEYELELSKDTRGRVPVEWENLKITKSDNLSIEHIFPQTPTVEWLTTFKDIPKSKFHLYAGSLGNLLLLSLSINKRLQNDSFRDKKNPSRKGKGARDNGYSNGSLSEMEVARSRDWTPAKIRDRGITLLEFMERRWNFKFKNRNVRASLLFLPKETDS